MFPYIFLISLSALSMGVLNSFHRFGAPALAPVVLNLTMIAFSFLGGLFGDVTRTLAVGVVAGGILQLAIQIPALMKSGWKIVSTSIFNNPGVQRVGKLIVPVIFGVGIVQINLLVDTQFASYLAEGSVTAIHIADRVMELVLGVYAVAISTVILPLLSRQAALRQMTELKTTLNFATRLILFITIPATVGLVLLRREIIEVLFQHGEFDAASTALTAWALPFFAIGLSAFAMVKVIVPAFYALQDTRTPVKIAFVAMFLNIGLNFLFIRPLQNGGPALATSLSALFNSGRLARDLLSQIRGIRHRRNRSIDCQICGGVGCARDCGVRDDSLARTLFRRVEPEDCGPGNDDWSGNGDVLCCGNFAACT